MTLFFFRSGKPQCGSLDHRSPIEPKWSVWFVHVVFDNKADFDFDNTVKNIILGYLITFVNGLVIMVDDE